MGGVTVYGGTRRSRCRRACTPRLLTCARVHHRVPPLRGQTPAPVSLAWQVRTTTTTTTSATAGGIRLTHSSVPNLLRVRRQAENGTSRDAEGSERARAGWCGDTELGIPSSVRAGLDMSHVSSCVCRACLVVGLWSMGFSVRCRL